MLKSPDKNAWTPEMSQKEQMEYLQTIIQCSLKQKQILMYSWNTADWNYDLFFSQIQKKCNIEMTVPSFQIYLKTLAWAVEKPGVHMESYIRIGACVLQNYPSSDFLWVALQKARRYRPYQM